MRWRAFPVWGRSPSVSCGTPPGTRAACRTRLARCSICGELRRISCVLGRTAPHLHSALCSADRSKVHEGKKDRAMATARPRPQVIRLTDAAADRIKYVMANAAKPVVAVRVGVRNGGCAGMAY